MAEEESDQANESSFSDIEINETISNVSLID